jgi:hypothetical protein
MAATILNSPTYQRIQKHKAAGSQMSDKSNPALDT